MTAEDILRKLNKRSVHASKAYDTWLAQGYSLADLHSDLTAMIMQSHGQPTGQTEPQPNAKTKR